jgi:hypothetical protein
VTGTVLPVYLSDSDLSENNADRDCNLTMKTVSYLEPITDTRLRLDVRPRALRSAWSIRWHIVRSMWQAVAPVRCQTQPRHVQILGAQPIESVRNLFNRSHDALSVSGDTQGSVSDPSA